MDVSRTQPYQPPIIDIATGLAIAQLSHSPDFSACPPPNFIGGANLNMTGSRAGDRRSLALHLQTPGNGCHCHHTYSYVGGGGFGSCTMQFVNDRYHIGTYPHAGAVRQYNVMHPQPYRAVLKSADELVLPQPYGEEDIGDLESKHGVTLSDALRKAYLAKHPSKSGGEDAGRFLPLFSRDDAEVSVDYVLGLANIKESMHRNGVVGLTPYAYDECGNIFYSDDHGRNYFYDHESDTYTQL